MVFTITDGLRKSGWLCLKWVRKYLFMSRVPWPLRSVLSETGTTLQNQLIFGIEFLMYRHIVSDDFLLLDTKCKLSVTFPLQRARVSALADVLTGGSRAMSRGQKSFCQVLKYLMCSSNSSSAWNTDGWIEKTVTGFNGRFFSIVSHKYICFYMD